ncbi:MAG: hypothetical protein K6G19_10785 [Lachnospiraceae bacterium]|nr:hypothetical protein [Lachnospiraceae bacterium]
MDLRSRTKSLRFVFFVLAVIFLLAGCSAGGDAVSKEDGPIELIWWTYTPDGTAPDALEEVMAKANEMSAEKIGVTVKMIYKTDDQFELDLSTGEYYDMAFSCDWCNDFDTNASNGYYYDITDLVQTETPELYSAVDPWWEVGTLNDRVYGVPML